MNFEKLGSFYNDEMIVYDEPWKIEFKMGNLLLDLNNHTISVEEFLIRFLNIHPFDDGNGRTIKMLFCFITLPPGIFKMHELLLIAAF